MSIAGSSSSTEDFYSLLNCDESSSAEQISTEFKLLARKHHPDKVASQEDKEASEKYFIVLKRARDVLLDSDMRHKYDQWRAGFRMWINFEDWLKMQSRLHTSIHWATPTQKMPSLEHRERVNSVSCSTCSNELEEGGIRHEVVGDEGERKLLERWGGSGVASSLQEFRRSAGKEATVSKFRNYQL